MSMMLRVGFYTVLNYAVCCICNAVKHLSHFESNMQHWGGGHHTPFLGAQSKVVFPTDRWHNIKEKNWDTVGLISDL